MSRPSVNIPDMAEPSDVLLPLNLNVVKIENDPLSSAQTLDSNEHRRLRESADDLTELPGGGAACYHARGVELEISIQSANCDCEGAMTRARKRRLSDSPICDWQFVYASPDAESCALSSHSASVGVVLPASYLQFAESFRSKSEAIDADGSGRYLVAVGMLLSGRIIKARVDSLLKAPAPVQFDVVAFADNVSRACSECHLCGANDPTEETAARNFVSKMQVDGGVLSCPTFESIFDRLCTVCFNHTLRDCHRASFLRALHCVCSFKSFQARFATRRGQLALMSLLHSCRSCLCADLALNCVLAISKNKTSACLVCPAIVGALFCLVDSHVSAASKLCSLLELWYHNIAHLQSTSTARDQRFCRLQVNGARQLVLDHSVLIRLATLMPAFEDTTALASSARLLQRVMATESVSLLPFIESKEFCAPVISRPLKATHCFQVPCCGIFLRNSPPSCVKIRNSPAT